MDHRKKERMKSGGIKREEKRKLFETVSDWEEWRKEEKLYPVVFDRRRQTE